VYLDEWQKSVEDRVGFTRLERNKMMLSPETILGLKITGTSFDINVYIIM
jgi:hypothetical protein